MVDEVIFKCSRCDSRNVYGFRLDQDCGAQADDLAVKA